MIPNSDQSMAERLFTTAEMYPDMPALGYFGKQITYQHLQEKIQRLAMIWKNLGIEPGHRVIVCLPNIPEV
ncbi:MAG TPA: long-chain fatty acid--CoA ligase, partial [Candidatus Atribacteria bacterium]|nr:long-chain fatty acid--CoA ligase [Candidatus Atribacteria bacterium]